MSTDSLSARQRARRAAGSLRASARNQYFAQRCAALLRAAPEGASPKAVFSDAPDDLWRWANIEGLERSAGLRALLPNLPPDVVQKKFTGNAGKVTLGEGYRFYRTVKQAANDHRSGGFATCHDVLDYGCGWGRIIRFWLKDFEAEHVTGIDCMPLAIETCRANVPGVRFELTDPFPPTMLESESVDLISTFSVFSHLSEAAHLGWLAEFQRILRPGGVLVATTWPRSFIEDCVTFRDERDAGLIPAHHVLSTLAFEDTQAWLDRYDRGELCHDATGGGEGLSSDFCGETLIPKDYVERVWTEHLDVMEYISDRQVCTQDVIVARKR